jgi:hypothetical protein
MTGRSDGKGTEGVALPQADRAVAADAAEPVVSALRASIPSAVEQLASTLEWCADQGRIEGLHPPMVRKAAMKLREQAEQIVTMSKVLAANTPTVLFDEREGLIPYTTSRRFTFVAAKPQGYQVETQHDVRMGYPVEVEARRAVSMFVKQFETALLPLVAQAIEARQRQDAKAGLARKGESAVPEGNAP